MEARYTARERVLLTEHPELMALATRATRLRAEVDRQRSAMLDERTHFQAPVDSVRAAVGAVRRELRAVRRAQTATSDRLEALRRKPARPPRGDREAGAHAAAAAAEARRLLAPEARAGGDSAAPAGLLAGAAARIDEALAAARTSRIDAALSGAAAARARLRAASPRRSHLRSLLAAALDGAAPPARPAWDPDAVLEGLPLWHGADVDECCRAPRENRTLVGRGRDIFELLCLAQIEFVPRGFLRPAGLKASRSSPTPGDEGLREFVRERRRFLEAFAFRAGAVCLSDLRGGAPVVKLPCGGPIAHALHRDCARRLLRAAARRSPAAPTCPTCRCPFPDATLARPPAP